MLGRSKLQFGDMKAEGTCLTFWMQMGNSLHIILSPRQDLLTPFPVFSPQFIALFLRTCVGKQFANNTTEVFLIYPSGGSNHTKEKQISIQNAFPFSINHYEI